jgi:hypothetical protein
MNQKTTYEITIAEKLGELTVPHLRDAIWSRISDQLDMDMPEGEEPPKPGTPGTPRWISFTNRFGILAVIAAALTILFTSQKQTTSNTDKNNAPASIQPQATPVNSAESPPIENKITTLRIESVVSVPGNAPTVMNDSFINIPFTGNRVVVDTVPPEKAPPLSILQVTDPLKSDTIPKKKSKGFKGMSDDDYRISLKKDSVP